MALGNNRRDSVSPHRNYRPYWLSLGDEGFSFYCPDDLSDDGFATFDSRVAVFYLLAQINQETGIK